MSEMVRVSITSGVGVVTIDNPPVNALSPGVPQGVFEWVQADVFSYLESPESCDMVVADPPPFARRRVERHVWRVPVPLEDSIGGTFPARRGSRR